MRALLAVFVVAHNMAAARLVSLPHKLAAAASTAGSVPLHVESIAHSVMNFDALLGDELMLARVAVRYHVVHAAHAESRVCVQCVVMVACVAGWSNAAFSTVAAGGGKPMPPYVHVFDAVSVFALMLPLCAFMSVQC